MAADVKRAEAAVASLQRDLAVKVQEVAALRDQLEATAAQRDKAALKADEVAGRSARLQSALDQSESRLDAAYKDLERLRADAYAGVKL